MKSAACRGIAGLMLGGVIHAGAGEANYQPFVVGERAAGMGGAVTATADGMDACFYNPAGLGGETRDSLSVNATLYGIQNYKTADAAFPGEDFKVSSFATIPTGLSAVRRLKPGTVAAFSVFVPSQSKAREIQSFPDRQHYYNYSQDEQTLQMGPSLGHVVNDRLALGVSIFGVYQTASEFQNLYWGDYAYTYTANYTYSVLGVAGVLGAQYRLAGGWSAGLACTTPSATLAGQGRIQVSEVLGDAAAAGAGAVYYDDLEADNGLPAHVRAGIGWRRPDTGGFGLDVKHHLARDFDWMDGDQAGERIVIRHQREAVTDVQLGGEWIFRKRYPVRAGFFTSFSAAPDPDPEVASTPKQIDLYGITLGAGISGDNVILNFGLSQVWGSGKGFGTRFDEAGNLQTVVVRSRENALYAFAGTTYRF
jgi:hypothetical protein